MIRVCAIERFEQIGSLFLPGVRLVDGRCIRKEREGVEHLRFDVGLICGREVAHCVFIVKCPGAIGEGVVLIDETERMDELPLALGAGPDPLRPLNLFLRDRSCFRRHGRVP